MDQIKTTPKIGTPLTPLLPSAGRFNFSPSAINRILAKDSDPSYLKIGNHKARRSFTPIRSRNNSSTPLVSPILGEYKIPTNSPINCKLPSRIAKESMKILNKQSANYRPEVNLLNPLGETVINLISPMENQKVQCATIDLNCSDESVVDLTSPMITSPFHALANSNSASSSDTSIRLMDSSFDAVVKAANSTIHVTQPQTQIVQNAHLNEDLSVTNTLDGINMGHLGSVFERENIDINIFSMLTAFDLEAIGIVGDEQTAVMSAVTSFAE